jgi:hypothetical protein
LIRTVYFINAMKVFSQRAVPSTAGSFLKVSELFEIILETDTIEYFFNQNSAPARQQRPTADNCKAFHAAFFERFLNKPGICRGFKRFNHFHTSHAASYINSHYSWTHLTVDHLHHRMSMHFESVLICPQVTSPIIMWMIRPLSVTPSATTNWTASLDLGDPTKRPSEGPQTILLALLPRRPLRSSLPSGPSRQLPAEAPSSSESEMINPIHEKKKKGVGNFAALPCSVEKALLLLPQHTHLVEVGLVPPTSSPSSPHTPPLTRSSILPSS